MEIQKINSDKLRAIGYDARARLLQAQLTARTHAPSKRSAATVAGCFEQLASSR